MITRVGYSVTCGHSFIHTLHPAYHSLHNPRDIFNIRGRHALPALQTSNDRRQPSYSTASSQFHMATHIWEINCLHIKVISYTLPVYHFRVCRTSYRPSDCLLELAAYCIYQPVYVEWSTAQSSTQCACACDISHVPPCI